MMNQNKSKSALTLLILFSIAFLVMLATPFAGQANQQSLENSTTAKLLSEQLENKIVYYYTDNPDAEDRLIDLKDRGFIDEYYLYYWQNNGSGNTDNQFLVGVIAEVYTYLQDESSITDSYIIVEISEFLPKETLIGLGITFTSILESFFQKLKTNGCEIMFICNTDEERFKNNNDFLDYVDVHINTDLFFIFMTNVFNRITNSCFNNVLNNYTIILDANISQNMFPNPNASVFFKGYLLAYLRSVYEEEIRYADMEDFEVMTDNNIYIIYPASGGQYFVLPEGETTYLDSDDFIDRYVICNNVCAIGEIIDYTYTETWLQELTELRSHLDFNFPIYLYNHLEEEEEAQYDMSYLDSLSNVFIAGPITDFSHIIEDFLQDQDLTVYDNWSGRCIVTHKTLTFGLSGWLVDVFDLDPLWNEYGIPGFDIYMSDEDREYYNAPYN